jgi:hypothetical protein
LSHLTCHLLAALYMAFKNVWTNMYIHPEDGNCCLPKW